ncbi:MAG TPA: hypothetical protein VHC97_18850 [Thermoanaerobaculia bacterium]|jgi:hypothetical protein|nr:hypothetical protein [Thermoanaerobaculia bacterium]
MDHAQDRHDVTLGCIEHAVGETGKEGTANAALSLGVSPGGLSYELELSVQCLQELVAKTSNLFLVPLIGLAHLAKRPVRDD